MSTGPTSQPAQPKDQTSPTVETSIEVTSGLDWHQHDSESGTDGRVGGDEGQISCIRSPTPHSPTRLNGQILPNQPQHQSKTQVGKNSYMRQNSTFRWIQYRYIYHTCKSWNIKKYLQSE